jgi:putative transposase
MSVQLNLALQNKLFGIALGGLKLAIKKTIRYSQRDFEKRIFYLRKLRKIIGERGSKNIVYLEKVAFYQAQRRNYGWAKRGKKVYGEKSGNSRPRTSLIAAKRGKQMLAPVLFEGGTDAIWLNSWLEKHLFKELKPQSTIIMDNAAFHKKIDMNEIATNHRHYVLFLPPYYPDFNPIEQDFANIKKIRSFANTNTEIDYIIKTYGY